MSGFLPKGANSVKGGSANKKFLVLVKIKFGFLFSGENFSEMSFLLLKYLGDFSFYFSSSIEKVRKSESGCNASLER